MKFYSAPMPAPNPRRVRMFAAEKEIALEETMLDLSRGEHKAAAHLSQNSLGQVPVLETDKGELISETLAICRYLDAIAPNPPMFGRNPLEIAKVEMWIRRIEVHIGEPVRMFWRHAHPATAALINQHTAFGESNRALLDRAMTWLDQELERAGPFLVGDAFTTADIVAVTIIDFAELIGMVPVGDRQCVTA